MSVATIRYAATDAQENFLYSSEPYVLGSGGYASGKSSILAVSCAKTAVENPGLFGMVLAETFGRLARDFIPKLTKVLSDSGIEFVSIPKVPGLDAKVPGLLVGPGWLDHTLLFCSAKNPNSVKGPTVSHIHVEEATLLPPQIPGLDEPTFNVLASRLRATAPDFQPSNVIRASGTPESLKNWTMQAGMFWRPPTSLPMHQTWQREFRVVTMSTWDTERAGFLPLGFTQKMVNVMTPDQVSEKIFGIPKAGAVGQAYPEFLYARNVQRVEFNRFLGDVIVGLDFNVNPMCAALMQENRGRLQIFDEISLPHSTTRLMAKELRRRMDALKVPLERVRLYPDASGASRHPASDSSSFGVLREEGLRRIIAPKANGLVSNRLECVNASLYHGRLIVDPKCIGVIEDFEQTARDDHGDLIKAPGRTHMTDAIGYPVVRLHPIRAQKGGLTRAA